jgi:hypothetical protein
MTEDEAEKKWCPFVRDEDGGSNVSNESRVPHWSTCVGSECMAWRWDTLIADQGSTLTHGGCGLVGKQL